MFKWIVIGLAALIAIAVGSWWYEQHRTESALLAQPVYRVLKEHDRSLYDDLLARYRLLLREEESRDRFVNFVNAEISKSATNAMSESGTANTTSAAASMATGGAALFNYLGGLPGVTRLAEAFGVNIAKSPILSKLFDAAAITQTKLGLVNEIAKASGMAPPNPGADLAATLGGRGLDSAGIDELNKALSAAADEVKVPEPQKSAVMAVMAPITNSLAGK